MEETVNWFEIICVILSGLTIGSFLNAVVYRLPRKIPFGTSHSACPSCKKTIQALDNIPLVSYAFLRGRCRNCQTFISWRYPALEAFNAGVYLWLYFQYGLTIELMMAALVTSALVAIIIIDIEHMIIPNEITLPGIFLALGYSTTTSGIGFYGSVLGMLVGGGSLYLIANLGKWLFKKESMGGGDVKMAAALGAFLGWQKVLLIFFFSAVTGVLVSAVVMIVSTRFRKERMLPFGAFLALAGFLVMLYGDQAVRMYRNYLLGL